MRLEGLYEGCLRDVVPLNVSLCNVQYLPKALLMLMKIQILLSGSAVHE